MTPDDQGVVLMLGLAFAATIISLFLIGTAGDPPGRHTNRPDPGSGPAPGASPPPDTEPIPIQDRITISMPDPRRYLAGIPTLTIDSPPGAHGTRHPDGLPVEHRWSCSLCLDGQLVMGRNGVCAWCGQPARGAR